MKVTEITDSDYDSAIVKFKTNKIGQVNTIISDNMAFQEKNERKKIGQQLLLWSFFREVSFGGLRYVGNTSLSIIRRMIWLLIAVSSFVGICYMVSINVQYLLARPTNTKVEISYRDQLKFPSVTLCNYNLIRSILWSEDYESYEIVRRMFPIYLDPEPDFSDLNLTNFDFKKLIKEYGHQIEDIMFYCEFKGESCDQENFTAIITDFGICYTFNGADKQEPLYSDSAGISFGLELSLNVEQYYYMNGPHDSVGFKIFIGDQNEIPQMEDTGFAVSPGQTTLVGLKVKEIINLEAPYGNCDIGSLKYYDSVYTRGKCLLECKTDYIFENCGCIAFFMPEPNSSSRHVCGPDETYECYVPKINEFAKRGTTSCGCPNPCTRVIYTPSLSYASFPTHYFNERLMYIFSITDVDFYKQNLAQVNIYFEEISVESITEQPAYEPFNLFNDIGGCLGLLAGASIITALEILDFMVAQIVKAIIF